MITSYRTISGTGEGTYREKGSKFIGVVCRVNSIEAFKEQLENVRKEHHGARHHCYGFILGNDSSYTKSNDDGEPNGTAGTPILRKLQNQELTFAGVVVVRYYGGTKLGKAGLVRAYGEAAELAIGNARIITEQVKQSMRGSCPIGKVEVLRGALLSVGGVITDEEYGQQATLHFQIPLAHVTALKERFALSEVMIEEAST